MSNLISLKEGVAVMGTHPVEDHITNMELAERLELAEELIQLREKTQQQDSLITRLKDEAKAGVGQLEKLSLQDGDLLVLPDELDEAGVQVLVNHVRDSLGIKNIAFVMGDISLLSDDEKAQIVSEQIEKRVSAMRSELIEVRQENQHLHDYNAELKAAGDQLGKQVDLLKEDNRELVTSLTKANREQAKAQKSKTEAEKQLKELKKLEPERLKKQVAELKKSNQAKQADIEALRKQNHKFVKDNKAKAKTIEGLDQALDKACADMNKQQQLEPLETVNCGNLGKWEIHGTGSIYRYNVLDKKNDVSMTLHIENGQAIIPEMRTPPKSLMRAVIARAARNAATEAKIENDQKPLEQGVV